MLVNQSQFYTDEKKTKKQQHWLVVIISIKTDFDCRLQIAKSSHWNESSKRCWQN